jgi:hypothetical protein
LLSKIPSIESPVQEWHTVISEKETIRKGPPKWKRGADIMERLDDMKESENGVFEGCLWELPYAKALILPHNIDLMHQEWNVAESIRSLCLDVTGFIKDNMDARKDLAALCDRPSLEGKSNARGKLSRPKAPCYLKPTRKERGT